GKGRPRKPRPLVDTTPRICVYDVRGVATVPLTTAPARETVTVVINGADGDRCGARCSPPWRRRAALFFVPDLLAKSLASLRPSRRATRVPEVRRLGLSKQVRAPARIEPCAPAAREDRRSTRIAVADPVAAALRSS